MSPAQPLLRYERWRGERAAGRWTWLTIVLSGWRLGFKTSRNTFVIYSSFALAVAAVVFFYLVSQLEQMAGSQQARGMAQALRGFLGVDLRNVQELQVYREVLWQTIFLLIMKTQLIWVLVVVARVGPGLIANDLKARALPIYFARPVTPLTYLLAKWLVAAGFIAMVTLIPNLLALIGGTIVTGGLDSFADTLSLGADIVVVNIGVMLLAGVVVLALSSLTSDARYVTIAWVALALVPHVAQNIVTNSLHHRATGFLTSLSFRNDIAYLSQWIFGIEDAWSRTGLPPKVFRDAVGDSVEPLYPGLSLLLLFAAAIGVVYWRIRSFSRSAASQR